MTVVSHQVGTGQRILQKLTRSRGGFILRDIPKRVGTRESVRSGKFYLREEPLVANEPLERFLPLEGCFNFRDLGGYSTLDGRTVKWRKLFRSDNHFHLTNEDIDYVANTLGVVTVVDLRTPEEYQKEASRANIISTAQYHNIPFLQELLPPPTQATT